MAGPLLDVHLNLRVRGMRPSATVAINDHSNLLLREGREIFKLGLGQSPFPVPEPVVEALREHAHEKDYLPAMGLWRLREVVAEQHAQQFGFDCEPDDVLIGPGSKELMFILQLVYYGDLVIPAPAWVSYAPQAKIIGRQIHTLTTRPENNWHPTAEDLERLCAEDPHRPRILILNYPSNPTGTTMPREQMAELARVAQEHKVVLLSDEIYGRIHHDGLHESIVPMYPQGTICSTGLSKWCGAGGWRLGIFIFPESLRWLRKTMGAVATETYTSTSAPIQHAAVSAFEPSDEIDNYLAHSRRVLKALGNRTAEELRSAGAEVSRPDGAFYLFPDFSAQRESLHSRGVFSSMQFCERLLADTGVAVLPGSDFGRPESEFTLRLAYVDFNGRETLAAARRSPEGELGEEFLTANCGRVLEATRRIGEWVRG